MFPSVQNYIISRLKNADFLRYRDMLPPDTANDLYNYHLKQLISKNVVEKTARGYTLTAEGEQLVADKLHTSDEYHRLFKVNPILIVCRTGEKGIEVINQERTARPSYGKIGIPGGTIVKGEPLLEGAQRKLRQETGLSAESFRLLGHERRMQYRDGELFSDIIFPICLSDTVQGEPLTTEFGRNFWVGIDEAIANEMTTPDDNIESIITVLTALKEGTLDALPLFYTETKQ